PPYEHERLDVGESQYKRDPLRDRLPPVNRMRKGLYLLDDGIAVVVGLPQAERMGVRVEIHGRAAGIGPYLDYLRVHSRPYLEEDPRRKVGVRGKLYLRRAFRDSPV